MKLATLFLACATALSTGCIITTDEDSTLTVDNQSDYLIEQIYIVEDYNEDTWGPNLLDEPLYPDQFIVIDLDCGVYDALIVDSEGVECELDAIDLCFDDSTWVFENNFCDVYGVAARKPSAASKADATPIVVPTDEKAAPLI